MEGALQHAAVCLGVKSLRKGQKEVAKLQVQEQLQLQEQREVAKLHNLSAPSCAYV